MSALNVFRIVGDLAHLASIFFLGQKIFQTRSCAGISLKSQILYMVVYVARYLDLFTTYAKHDFLRMYNTILKLFFLGFQSAVLYFMMSKYKATVDPRMDSFRHTHLLLGVPCLVLAFFFMDSRGSSSVFESLREYLWTFSILLEAVAILPQLFQLQRTGEAEGITTHYLLGLGVYRGLYLLNWIYRWALGERVEGIAVLAGLVQTALYSDLFWLYYKVFKNRYLKLPV